MKILMLGWELPPNNSGGLGVACFKMCKALADVGVSIQFVLPYKHDQHVDFMQIETADNSGVVKVENLYGAYESHSYSINTAGGVSGVRSLHEQRAVYDAGVEKLVESLEFDVIHAHDWITFSAAMKAKAKTGRPLILHLHSTEHDRSAGSYGNPLVRDIEYNAMIMADRIIAVSDITKQIIAKEYSVPEDKIEVVHNSIDINDTRCYDNFENDYKFLDMMKNSGYKVVSSISRLTIQKGLANLLQAMRLVIEKNNKVMLLIVGSGEQYQELIAKSAELGISENVVFADFQRGKRLRDAFRIADLFVLPSVSEPFGLTALEAVGYGTPSLVTYQSGVKEVVNNFLRVDFWDVREMANKILSVVEFDALKEELHTNSLQEFNKLSWSHSASKIIDIYNQYGLGVKI